MHQVKTTFLDVIGFLSGIVVSEGLDAALVEAQLQIPEELLFATTGVTGWNWQLRRESPAKVAVHLTSRSDLDTVKV